MPFKFLKRKDPIIIIPYGGYLSSSALHASARVLEDEGVRFSPQDSFIKNFINSYKRFETDEQRDAAVHVIFKNKTWTLTSDREGYINFNQNIASQPNKTNKTQWLPIQYQLNVKEEVVFSIDSELMYPSEQAEFGIISDLDETVLDTGLSSTFKYKVIINTFFKNSSKRMPLKGVLHFYQLLEKGGSGKAQNPFFYLSNSPWNIYDYLIDFLKFNNFPKGVLLLRDIGFENKKKSSFLKRNKFLKISHILNTYENMTFVLIGDAVDIDHDIYIEIARRFPKRIKTIYIRTVANRKKMKLVEKLIESTTDISIQLIKNSAEAIIHAKANKLIKIE